MTRIDRQIAALRRGYGLDRPVPPRLRPRLRAVLALLRRSLRAVAYLSEEVKS